MKSINRRSLLYFALAVAAALALYGLSARLAAEGGGKTAAFVTDSREIFSLAYQSGKTPAEIAALDMGVFAEAVFTLMASEDFRDFFTRLMKRLGQTK